MTTWLYMSVLYQVSLSLVMWRDVTWEFVMAWFYMSVLDQVSLIVYVAGCAVGIRDDLVLYECFRSGFSHRLCGWMCGGNS